MNRNRTLRRIGWVVTGVGLTAALAAGLVLGAPRTKVEVGTVTRGDFTRTVEEDGRARIRDRYVLSAPVAGTLERVERHVGDRVRAGDVLAVLHPVASELLDPRSRAGLEAREGAAQAALAAARANLERAEAAAAHGASELERARRLVQGGSLPERDLEHAELEATVATRERDSARFALRMAEHEVETARAALAAGGRSDATSLPVRSPIDGLVLRVFAENEGVVAPGTPLLELGDPSAMEVVVDLLSTDAVRVEVGGSAELTGFGTGEHLEARVRLVEPTASIRLSALGVEERRVDVVLDPLDPAGKLARVGEGYAVDVRIPIERRANVLRIPTSALFRVGDRWCVFVLREGRVRRATVSVPSYGPLVSVVAGGIAEGARVVLEPPEELEEGERVEVEGESR